MRHDHHWFDGWCSAGSSKARPPRHCNFMSHIIGRGKPPICCHKIIRRLGFRRWWVSFRVARHTTRIRPRPGCKGCERNRLLTTVDLLLHLSAELNTERFPAVVLILPSEFKHCNLRPGPESDGEAGGADAAIDVKHRASVLIPSVGVTVDQTTEVELTANDLQRQLPAMRVPG